MRPEPGPVHRLPLHGEWTSLPLIDYLCLLWPDRAQRTIRELFANGLVRQGKMPVSPRTRVGEVDELTLHADPEAIPRMFSGPPPEPRCEPGILHEDERLVVLSKPAGLSVVPDRSEARGSCLEFLARREILARAAKPPREYLRPRVVHRIDRWTSGLVIVAKTPDAERRLAADFEARRVRKEYLAIVSGSMAPARVVVSCPVGPGRKGKMRAVAAGARGGRDARTTFDALERLGDVTLVRALPETGRQHQIRVHAWVMGHPLAIDPLYAVGPDAYHGPPLAGIDRLTLHAHRYTLPPDWDEPRSFCCPPPDDFQRALDALREG